MKAKAQIFLSYAREDEEKVGNLYQELSDAGFKPWMDQKDILPGERWRSSIQKAIQRSDFFLACLSANSVKRGFLQKEINDALDIWQEMFEDDIYLIPVRLEDCEVPKSLRDFQWVNLFEENGWTRLVKAIQVGMERRPELIKPKQYDTTKKPSQISRVGVSSSKSRVEITLRGDLSEFTPAQQSAVVGALAGILNIPREQVHVLEIRGGSTILQIEMPIEAVNRLISLYEASDPIMQALGIQQVRVIPGTEMATPEEGPERIHPHPVPPPYQVPLLPLQYVRRPAEEARLKATLLRGKEREGTSSILAIEGMSGVGKSTLIVAVARDGEVIDHFKDGILWATLGPDVNVLDRQDDWAIALGGSTFGYDLKQVHDKQSKTGLLRTLLRDKVCLLVIDDAWKSTDVEALCVGGQDCWTVITTRISKIVDSVGAIPFHLDAMELEEAEKLLRKWAGAELEREDTELITELAKRLGRLPLALRLAGRQILRGVGLEEVLDYFRREQGVDLSELDFEDPETKQESLRIAFDLSLAHLDEPTQKHYKQLGVFAAEADFDVTAAAAVWEMEESRARKILRRLNGEALLDLSKKNTDQPARSDNVYNVYRLHILLRDYARAELDNDEKRTAANRHLNHYWNICRKLEAMRQMPEEAPLEQIHAAYCHAVEMQDLRAIDLASMIGAFPPKKRVDARLRFWQRPYEPGLTRISILGGVGTGPPATEVPDALAATIADDVISSRPAESFVWTSGGHSDVEPT